MTENSDYVFARDETLKSRDARPAAVTSSAGLFVVAVLLRVITTQRPAPVGYEQNELFVPARNAVTLFLGVGVSYLALKGHKLARWLVYPVAVLGVLGLLAAVFSIVGQGSLDANLALRLAASSMQVGSGCLLMTTKSSRWFNRVSPAENRAA